MSVHARAIVTLDVVHREALAARLVEPITARELARLRMSRHLAQVEFRGRVISNAVIRELVAVAERESLPVFVPRQAALVQVHRTTMTPANVLAQCLEDGRRAYVDGHCTPPIYDDPEMVKAWNEGFDAAIVADAKSGGGHQ